MKFAKGHGTQNDFVLLLDTPAGVDLTPGAVAALCDRRRGLGADGVLRVTVAGAARDAGVFDTLPEGVGADDWFMDYRNADGSPLFSAQLEPRFIVMAALVATCVGLLSALIPARRASRMDPVQAIRS
mgnify:CR=1 FL=1